MSKRNAAFHPVLPLFFPVNVFSLRPDYLWFGKGRAFFFPGSQICSKLPPCSSGFNPQIPFYVSMEKKKKKRKDAIDESIADCSFCLVLISP